MLNSRRPRIRPEQKITPKDFCGGTAQLDSKTTVPSRGQRVVFLTRRRTKHANIAQGKPQAGASHPSGTLGKKTTVRSYDIAVAAPRRLPKFSKLQYHKFARNISPESRSPLRLFARAPHLSGHGRIAWLLPRASPVAPTYAPSRAGHAMSMFTHHPAEDLHLKKKKKKTYPRGPPATVATSQYSQPQSTAACIRVPSGSVGLAEQGKLKLLYE